MFTPHQLYFSLVKLLQFCRNILQLFGNVAAILDVQINETSCYFAIMQQHGMCDEQDFLFENTDLRRGLQ